eukprot:CAMPEP_0119103504 /NCGR_PEP_ID=MMETSP1180-20130426/1940_1 /TAXON_ID=3052 ORGANISM="Chlamydomonas cf sp, Strain CCMP681" /NCGR_SAMPLE_ID=MMETSP1180 /ASSEMBLY_ACC=CAM_ASM_000741 /LENGTH=538 /DNA_ID=CAMNT_0007088035 /DNA_START=156 /DNA_END=1772 /DNA_ORIENTATION=-
MLSLKVGLLSHEVEVQPDTDSSGAVCKETEGDSAGLESVKSLEDVKAAIGGTEAGISSLRGFFIFAGSSLLAAVSFLDPGNLEADVVMGSTTGFSLLWWTGVCALCFGFTFQCFSGRLGLVSGKDLAAHLGDRYPAPARILLWILMEMAIVGADIQETIGAAIAISILSNGTIPLAGGCVIVSLSAFGLLLLDSVGFRQLELLFLALIGVEAIALGVVFVNAKVPSESVARGLIPMLTSETLPQAVGALGAIVMPYNLFYASSVIIARHSGTHTPKAKNVLLRYMRIENFLVLGVTFVVNLFVIAVFAHIVYGTEGADQLGLESAGVVLGQNYGIGYQHVWAVGLLASGQVATIAMTHAGQTVMMGLLKIKVHAGVRMLAVRSVALVPTLTLAVLFEASHTFDKVAQALNIVQSLVLPFAMIPIIHVAADKRLLGDWATKRPLTIFAAVIALAVAAVNGYLLVVFMQSEVPGATRNSTLAGFAAVILIYYSMLLYFAVGPEHWKGVGERARGVVNKIADWGRANRRKADFASMLEVHM